MANVADIVARHGAVRENLLLMLHDLQDSTPGKFLRSEDLREVAAALGLPVSEVKGTASFYSMFSFQPRGEHIIRVCDSPPCFVLGSELVLNAVREKLGIEVGETSEDGMFTLETSSCLGLCGVAPAMMIDDEAYGNLTPERIGRILDTLAATEAVS